MMQTHTEVFKQEEQALKIPQDYLCPITHQLMLEPVVATDGETYEREAIETYFQERKEKGLPLISPIPINNQPIDERLILNRRMLSNIREFLTQHPAAWQDVYLILLHFDRHIERKQK